MNVLIIGGGSAGQRHCRMLQARGHFCNIVDIDNPIPANHPKAEACVIASPPETHELYLKWYADKIPILCEGPVTWYPSENQFPHLTASNWLFVKQIQNLKNKIDSSQPVSSSLWFDYDLAKWRGPGWDYKASCYYESGIDLINCHEAMTALWLFGNAADVKVYRARTGKSNSFDSVTASIIHDSGVLTTINVGWHAAQYQRGIRVVFKDGSVEELGWSSPQDDVICNQSYAAMLDHWLAAIRSNDVNVRPSLLDGYRAYKLMQGETA